MKRNVKLGLGILILSLGLVTVGCKNTSTKENKKVEQKAEQVQYTCPMHTEIVQDQPGNCPKCGMALVEK